jgi:hypothetical protein
MSGTIIALASALLGSLIGGGLAIYGGIVAVRRTEYYRLRPRIKRVLKYTISKVGQHNFPWVLVRDDVTDDLVSDIIRVMPYCKRRGFEKEWQEYRYDKSGDGTVPDEYEKLGSVSGRRLIIERLQNLISMI